MKINVGLNNTSSFDSGQSHFDERLNFKLLKAKNIKNYVGTIDRLATITNIREKIYIQFRYLIIL